MSPEPMTDRPEIDQVLLAGAVANMLSLSRPTLWRLVKRGAFPRPLRLSPRRIGWRRSTIEAWLAEREAAAGGCSKSTEVS